MPLATRVGGRGMIVKLARGRENTACTSIKWAWSQTARQVFIVAPHFNVVLTLQNNTTLKLRGGGGGKESKHEDEIQVIQVFPEWNHTHNFPILWQVP